MNKSKKSGSDLTEMRKAREQKLALQYILGYNCIQGSLIVVGDEWQSFTGAAHFQISYGKFNYSVANYVATTLSTRACKHYSFGISTFQLSCVYQVLP